ALQLGAQVLDVLALLADDDPGTGAVHGDLGVLRRTLDHDLAHHGVRQLLLEEIADLDVVVQHVREVLAVRIPARGPVALDGKAKPGRVDFLAHAYSLSPTVT